MKKIIGLILSLSLISFLTTPVFAAPQDELTEKQNLIQKSTGYTIKPTYPSALNVSNFNFETKPGETINSEVYVKNFGTTKRSFKFYGVDGQTNEKGEFSATLPTDEQKAIGAWTKFETEVIDLEPDQYTNLQFNIKVPENIKPETYMGAIVMEEVVKTNTGGVTVATRIALRTEIVIRDTPLVVPAMAHRYYIPVINFWTTTFPKAYFWISSGLLVLSVMMLAASQRRKKKKNSKK